MFKGSVDFVARIKGRGLTFPPFDFNTNEPGVDKVEIEGLNGDEIQSTVHLSSVASHDDGRSLAMKVNTATLNRIAFFHNIAIENARSTGDQFSPLNPQPGVHMIAATGHMVARSGAAKLTVGISAAQLKTDLEQASAPGESNFGLFRSARQSTSPVEEFMHLYHILLMLYNDKQADVDAFIIAEDPATPQTLRPHGALGVMEQPC